MIELKQQHQRVLQRLREEQVILTDRHREDMERVRAETRVAAANTATEAAATPLCTASPTIGTMIYQLSHQFDSSTAAGCG